MAATAHAPREKTRLLATTGLFAMAAEAVPEGVEAEPLADAEAEPLLEGDVADGLAPEAELVGAGAAAK